MDQHMMRSHPNKAVDVVVCPNSWIDSGSRFINSGPALRNQLLGIVLSLAARFPLPPGWLGCRGYWRRHRMAQRLIDFSTHPEAVQ